MCVITDKSMSHNSNNFTQHAFYFFFFLQNDFDIAGDAVLTDFF